MSRASTRAELPAFSLDPLDLIEQPPTDRERPSLGRRVLNKVPEVTLYFWISKVLCTTVGETAADNLNSRLKLGLTNTTYLMGGLLLVVLALQFRKRRYVPGIYWLAVVLLSIVGTLITDNLTDNFGVALETTTIVFGLGPTNRSVIFLARILMLVVYLTATRKDVILGGSVSGGTTDASSVADVLVVANKTAATPALIETVRERAAAGPARFRLLVPNPHHPVVHPVGKEFPLGG